MSATNPSDPSAWADVFDALKFLDERFDHFRDAGFLSKSHDDEARALFAVRRKKFLAAFERGWPAPDTLEMPPARPGESRPAKLWRYWTFVRAEARRLRERRVIALVEYHDIAAAADAHRAKHRRDFTPDDDAHSSSAARRPGGAARPSWDEEPSPEPAPARPAGPPAPRRSLVEILLDPRSIQIVTALGGVVMVIGLVVLLWINELFTPATTAAVMAAANAAVMVLGWWVARRTRHVAAGRSLTLLACLVMPLNLWYHAEQHLPYFGDHLWVTALLVSALYAASAWAVRHEEFVYVFMAGLALTGTLFMADFTWFLGAVSPAVLLAGMGAAGVFAERLFPDADGPFGRKRFGLAFFWSGHALLAVGLITVFGRNCPATGCTNPRSGRFTTGGGRSRRRWPGRCAGSGWCWSASARRPTCTPRPW